MPAFKPDSSFFEKIVRGTVGTRAVSDDLNGRGHAIVELERGSTDAKLWKDVKRKRVRIPDLVCSKCGMRVESRAKNDMRLLMSHSPTEIERAWDFGMVDPDVVAYPICRSIDEEYWSRGKLNSDVSYWHERDWQKWIAEEHINYFKVGSFRAVPFVTLARKGVTEGSELPIEWLATFAKQPGTVAAVAPEKITISRSSDGRSMPRRIKAGQRAVVQVGQQVALHETIASTVQPLRDAELRCPGHLPDQHISRLLESRERTQRFTGVKLARIRGDRGFCDAVTTLVQDAEEDLYVRLEGIAYLAAVCEAPLADLIAAYVGSPDQQTQLEAVITLGETGTPDAVRLLGEILDNTDSAYFLRSAAAWGLSRIGGGEAARRLIQAFADVDLNIRQEALDGVVEAGGTAMPLLLANIQQAGDDAIAAGCAEALRQQGSHPNFPVNDIARLLIQDPSRWSVWLVGNLPRERVAAAVMPLQESRPELHYAISVLWSFVESWISRRWELRPAAVYPEKI